MTLPPARVQRAAWAVFAVFVLNGFNFATWASRLPAARDALGFSESQMGVLLFGIALGSMVALPLSGVIMQRLGACRTILVFAALNAVGYAVTAFAVSADSVVTLRIALFFVGMGTGVWDAAMNLEGGRVEQRLGRTIMPRLHAGFSLGTILGSGVGVLMAWRAVPLEWHLAPAMVVSYGLLLVTMRWFLPEPEPAGPAATGPSRASAFSAWLEPRTLLIGLVVLAAAITEGSANDWVGLAVVDGFGQSDVMGAVALNTFLVAMTGMRLLGTGLLDRHGRLVVLRLSGGLALVGLAVFALVPNVWVALVGVVVWGAGAALGFPVGMSAASDDPLRAAARVSVVATIGYSAFFVGPPLLGLLAEHVGYRHALLAILVPVVLGLVVARAAAPLRGAADGTGATTVDA